MFTSHPHYPLNRSTYSTHSTLFHLEQKNICVDVVVFINYSFSFNTIILSKLMHQCLLVQLDPGLPDRQTRPQEVQIQQCFLHHNHTQHRCSPWMCTQPNAIHPVYTRQYGIFFYIILYLICDNISERICFWPEDIHSFNFPSCLNSFKVVGTGAYLGTWRQRPTLGGHQQAGHAPTETHSVTSCGANLESLLNLE